MRQAMCTLMMSSHPRILFIDEGFGSADEDNFRIICAKVLPALAKSFEKVIIISHIMGIHDHTGANCPIGIINGHSRIQFGSVYPGGRDMTIFADHEKHTTALAEVRAKEKAESKAAKDAKKKETDAQQAKLADEKTASFGESIVERVDDKNVRCKACNRIYKLTDGFVAKHIKTDAHRKKLLTYE
jgi:ABC-type glutathione transport system ATPase component